MRFTPLLLAALFVILPCPVLAGDIAPLDAQIDAAATRGFAGVVAVSTGTGLVYSRAVGMADRAKALPHAVSRSWRLASFTKQVVAVLAMQEVDAGHLHLDDPIQATMPTLSKTPIGTVTLRQLLQYTSGLANPDEQIGAGSTVPDYYRASSPPAAGIVPGACLEPARQAPGKNFSYNNCDYLVVGAMLESVTGMPLARLLERRIARPLASRSLGVYRSATDGPRDVVGYDEQARTEPMLHLENFGGAGALYGSPLDVLAFDRALMKGQWLPRSSRAILWQGDPRWGFAALGAWSFDARIEGCAAPVRLIERRGEIGGIQLRNVIAPDRDRALVVLANSGAVSFGEVWQGTGLLADLLSAAFCRETP